jgi:diacylglycerol kinase (ATP)
MQRILSATLNSFRGLLYALRTEAAVQQEVAVLVVAVPLALFLAPNAAWYVAMISSLLLVLAVEFLNTATEKLADHLAPDRHVNIGRVKDYGSAAVACALLLAGLVWLAALGTRAGLL